MQNILVPIDFSENSRHAAIYASLLANQIDSAITFLHIFSVPTISNYYLPHDIERFIAQNRLNASDQLNSFVKEFEQESGIESNRITQRIEYGFIPEKIVAISNEKIYNFIVMGTKGVSDRFDKLIGSVAEKVVALAECPVFIISQKSFNNFPHTILYAADFENDEIGAIEKLIDFAKNMDLKLNIVHFQKSNEENLSQNTKSFSTLLNQKFENEKLEIKTIVDDEVIEGLEEYLKIQKPDILALAIHEKSIFKKIFNQSISKHFVHEAQWPMLCFKK